MSRIAPVLFLFAGLLGAGSTLGAETSAEKQSELKDRLDQARQEVDRAVDKLANLWKENGALDLDIDLDLDGFEAMGHRVEAAAVSRLVDLDADLGAYFGVNQGALVLNAPEDGPLKSGDVLLSVGGEAVTSARQARRMIAAAEEPVAAEVMRQKSRLSLSIAPDAFPRHVAKRIRIIKLDEEELP